MQKDYLAFDIGGTDIKYGLLDHSGNLIEHDKVATPDQNLDVFMAAIKTIIERFDGRFRGICFSVPGTIDHDHGEIIYGGGSLPFMDHKSLPELLNLGETIPVTVENDAKAAALAELWLGNLKGIKNGAVITLGTGVGGGIVANSQLLYGSHFQAGELSFMSDWQDIQTDTTIGKTGSAIVMIQKIAELLNLPNKKDGLAVFKAINASDPRVLAIFQDFCRTIAALINNVQTAIDGERFVIGGGISAQNIVIETIQKEYLTLRKAIPVLDATLKMPEIMEAKFHNDANLYGALYHMLLVVDQGGI
ncbi:MAG: ROK family protein [Oenococcus sp.]|uniref:ROK family protein n=1 Tax=Oenococcus TaxID=46254 RepID=UPI0021E7FED5|nr:ROK family protein [Oenococcus kitaharae]MCV3296605.1 ROK family protein [Oenococcus kitaharae]